MGALYITAKDLYLLLRDPRALVILVVLPLIFITIFGMSAGHMIGLENENQLLQIALVNEVDYEDVVAEELIETEEGFGGEDEEPSLEEVAGFDSDESETAADDDTAGGFDEPSGFSEGPTEAEIKLLRKNAIQLTQELIARLSNQPGVKVTETTREEAQLWIDEGKPHVMVVLGPEFFKQIDRLRVADLTSADKGQLADGLDYFGITTQSRSSISPTQSNVEDLVLHHVIMTAMPYVFCVHGKILAQSMDEAVCEQYEMHGTMLPLPEQANPKETAQNRAEVIYQELIPQFTVAFVFFLLTVMARSFIHEKQQGTLRRLRLAPIRPTSLLIGKTIPFFIISVLQTVLLFLAGRILFDMTWGPRPWALVLVIFCTSMAATGLGLLVATIVRTDSQVSWVGNAIVLTTAGISGCFMPRDWMPPVMQEVSKVTPHAWSLMGFKQLLSMDNPNLSIVFFNCTVLVGFALLFFVAGCLRVAHVE